MFKASGVIHKKIQKKLFFLTEKNFKVHSLVKKHYKPTIILNQKVTLHHQTLQSSSSWMVVISHVIK